MDTHTHVHTHAQNTHMRTHTRTHMHTHTHTHTHACIHPTPYMHLSLNHEGLWGTTDDFATSFLHFSLFSTALWDLVNPRPVHSLILSSNFFSCLPCLLPPFTVPCKMVFARPDEWDMSIPLQFVSLYVGQIFLWSDCLVDLGTDFLVGDMVFV